MNLFIEGVPGAGKSTLLDRLARALPSYDAYREGDLSPAELAWCSRMDRAAWEALLRRYPASAADIRRWTVVEDGAYITAYTRVPGVSGDFYAEMESHEIYNGRMPLAVFKALVLRRYRALGPGGRLFECSFFQNTIDNFLLFFRLSEEEILRFYRQASAAIANLFVLYLNSDDLEGDLLRVRRERVDAQGNEQWYAGMLRYLASSPYGAVHGADGWEDLLAYFRRRRALELRILRELLSSRSCVLPAKAYGSAVEVLAACNLPQTVPR